MARRDGPDIGRQGPQPRSCRRLGLFTVGSAGSIFSQLRLVCMPRWLNTFDCKLPTMRQLVVCAALLLVFQLRAHAETLLPSQEEQGLVTIKTCRNHEVLSSLKTAIAGKRYLLRGRTSLRSGRSIWICRPELPAKLDYVGRCIQGYRVDNSFAGSLRCNRYGAGDGWRLQRLYLSTRKFCSDNRDHL